MFKGRGEAGRRRRTQRLLSPCQGRRAPPGHVPGLLSLVSSASCGARTAVSHCSHPSTTSSRQNPRRSRRGSGHSLKKLLSHDEMSASRINERRPQICLKIVSGSPARRKVWCRCHFVEQMQGKWLLVQGGSAPTRLLSPGFPRQAINLGSSHGWPPKGQLLVFITAKNTLLIAFLLPMIVLVIVSGLVAAGRGAAGIAPGHSPVAKFQRGSRFPPVPSPWV